MARGDDLKEIKDDLKALERRVDAVERWQSWATGVGAGMIAVMGASVKGLLKKLGLSD